MDPPNSSQLLLSPTIKIIVLSLKQEEDIIILFRFKEKYIKSYYKVALRRYYKKDKPIILTTVY